MKTACLAFTKSGEEIARKLKKELEGEVECFYRDSYKRNIRWIFSRCDAVVFISATGIAVRTAAPLLQDKTTDPAVVVVDDMARYAISLVSGHLGGANDLARKVANILGCQPIVTTASDSRGFEAVDLYAKRFGLAIEDMADAKTITAMMVEGGRIGFFSDYTPPIQYSNLTADRPEGCIFVDIAADIKCETPRCVLRPKVLTVGLGFRRGKSGAEIQSAIRRVFAENNLDTDCIKALATIDLKRGEKGLLETRKAFDCSLSIYSGDDLLPMQRHFDQSRFVAETTGVGAVCEPCAFLGGNRLIVNRTAIDGITVAVSKPDKGAV